MSKRTTIVLILSLFVTFTYAAGSRRTLYVEESQEIALVPDLCVMVIGVETKGDNVSVAYDKNNRIMGKVNEIAKNEGISPQDLRTSQFSISEVTRYDREQATHIFDYYKVSHALVLKVRDFEKIVPIINGAIESGATQIREVNFVLENPKEHEKELREITLKAIQEKAEHISTLMGVRLRKPISINTSKAPIAQGSGRSTYASEVYLTGVSAIETRPIIEPGEIKLYYTVRITYEVE